MGTYTTNLLYQKGASIVDLFKPIDKRATIRNVRDFFDNEDKFPTIKRRAGVWGLQSPQMDVTGVHGSPIGNAQENKALRLVEYRKAVRAVFWAVEGCSFRSRQILQYRYIDQLPGYQVREKVYLSGHKSYQKADQWACLEFADTVDAAKQDFGVNDEMIPDFHVCTEKS